LVVNEHYSSWHPSHCTRVFLFQLESNRVGRYVFWTQVGQKEEYLQPSIWQREEPTPAFLFSS